MAIATGKGNQPGGLEDTDVSPGADRPRPYIPAQPSPFRPGHDAGKRDPAKLQAAVDAMDSLHEEIVSLAR